MKKEQNLLSLFRGKFILEGRRLCLSSRTSIRSLTMVGEDGEKTIVLQPSSRETLRKYLGDITGRDPRNVCRDEIEVSKDGRIVRMIVWSAYKEAYGPGP